MTLGSVASKGQSPDSPLGVHLSVELLLFLLTTVSRDTFPAHGSSMDPLLE